MMRTSTFTGALALWIALAAPSAGWATAAQCTVEVLTVEGTPLTVSYCITAAPRSTGTQEIIVPVVATYSAPGRSLRFTNELHFLAGEGVSRVLESLDLSKLGLTRHAAPHAGLHPGSGARGRGTAHTGSDHD